MGRDESVREIAEENCAIFGCKFTTRRKFSFFSPTRITFAIVLEFSDRL